jgi:hypothetical protein
METALAIAREGSDLAQQCGLKRERGQAERILGEALIRSGELPDVEHHLLAALAQAERIGCRYDRAKAQHSLGKLYLERDALDQALAHLNAALSIFEALGAERDVVAIQQSLSNMTRLLGSEQSAGG